MAENETNITSDRYKDVFLRSPNGKWVLAHIVSTICGLYLAATNQEMAIKQDVAKEILSACGLWFGLEKQQTPEEFIDRLSR